MSDSEMHFKPPVWKQNEPSLIYQMLRARQKGV